MNLKDHLHIVRLRPYTQPGTHLVAHLGAHFGVHHSPGTQLGTHFVAHLGAHLGVHLSHCNAHLGIHLGVHRGHEPRPELDTNTKSEDAPNNTTNPPSHYKNTDIASNRKY